MLFLQVAKILTWKWVEEPPKKEGDEPGRHREYFVKWHEVCWVFISSYIHLYNLYYFLAVILAL